MTRPAKQPNSQTAKQPNSQTAKQPNSQTAKHEKRHSYSQDCFKIQLILLVLQPPITHKINIAPNFYAFSCRFCDFNIDFVSLFNTQLPATYSDLVALGLKASTGRFYRLQALKSFSHLKFQLFCVVIYSLKFKFYFLLW